MTTRTTFAKQGELPGIPAAKGLRLNESRGQAIADRVLVPVQLELSKQAGFRVPVALSAAAWEECVEWAEADAQDAIWSVLLATHCAIRAKVEKGATADFVLSRVAFGDGATSTVALVAVVGPDDNKAPALTIYLASEIY